MKVQYQNLSKEDVFFIFKESHRLSSWFDPEADPHAELTIDSTVQDWRLAVDLLEWKELGRYLNIEFQINISDDTWYSILEPANVMTMLEVCDLISNNARFEVISPVKLLGNECISAAIFRFIKTNFAKRGMDTTDLKPSSKIEPYLKKDFGIFLEQINKNFTGVIKEIKTGKTKFDNLNSIAWILGIVTLFISMKWNSIWYIPLSLIMIAFCTGYLNSKEFEKNDKMMFIPEVDTFRDLINLIITQKYTSHSSRLSHQ